MRGNNQHRFLPLSLKKFDLYVKNAFLDRAFLNDVGNISVVHHVCEYPPFEFDVFFQSFQNGILRKRY